MSASRWSIDFVADTLKSGRRFRILAVVDNFTRERLGLVVDTSLTGLRVARELDRIAQKRVAYDIQELQRQNGFLKMLIEEFVIPNVMRKSEGVSKELDELFGKPKNPLVFALKSVYGLGGKKEFVMGRFATGQLYEGTLDGTTRQAEVRFIG
jgi:hypothetical protein